MLYIGASLVAQLVKNLPAMQETPVQFLGHFLLQCMKVKSESEVPQSCPTLSDPMDCGPPGSSIHGISQARVLEWGAIAFSVGSYSTLNSFVICAEYIRRRRWHPTPVLLPGKSHGWRSLVGRSPWGC